MFEIHRISQALIFNAVVSRLGGHCFSVVLQLWRVKSDKIHSIFHRDGHEVKSRNILSNLPGMCMCVLVNACKKVWEPPY